MVAFNRIKYVAFLIIMAAVMLAPAPSYAAVSVLKLTVNQILCDTHIKDDLTFEYRLTPLENDAPMPQGCSAKEYSFEITGTGNHEIGPFSYNRQGVFRYDLSRINDRETSGVVHKNRAYVIEAHVDENLSVNLILNNEDGTKAESIAFEIELESAADIPQEEITTPSPASPDHNTVTGANHKTGDDMDIIVRVVVLAVSGIFAAWLAALVLRKKKSNSR